MKISVIMQVYLGEYPGSRSKPVDKFHRAIKSFLEQDHIEKELIIVSDGCDITHRIYNNKYKNLTNIKYAYVDKPLNRMYENIESKNRYYRGLPRQIGVELAEGDIICYFDSDDYLLKNHLSVINNMWNKVPKSVDWLSNNSWFDNQYRMYNPIGGEDAHDIFEVPNSSMLRRIDNLPDLWYPTVVLSNKISMETASISHKRKCKTKWKDSIGAYEDAIFFNNLKKDHPNAMKYQEPTYVRCHWINKWDF